MIDNRSFFQKKRVFVLEFLVLYLGPLYLLNRFSAVGLLRHGLMLLALIYVVFFVRYNRLNMKNLGLQRKNLKRSGIVSVGLSLLVAIFALVLLTLAPTLLNQGLMKLKVLPLSLPGLIFLYAVFSVPLQEFIFRSFLINRLELLTKNRAVVIGVSATLFALAHMMFQNVALIVSCFLAGLLWGWMFVTYRNLWSVQLSHAFLGSILIYLVLK